MNGYGNKNAQYFLIIVVLFVVIKSLLQINAIAPLYELHRDEYLHLDQGKHMAWGYLSVPPITSFFSYIIYHLGNGVFWVKFFPALFGVITIILVAFGVRELRGRLFATLLALAAVTFSILIRINTLYQPNSFEIMIWTLFYFVLIKYFNTKNNKWLLWLGVVFGIAFLNKYNIVFVVIGLLPAILLCGEGKLFKEPYFYYALLIGFVIICPNLYWQYQHHWVVFHHLNRLAETQLKYVHRMDFVKEQFLFFAGSFFVLIAALISFFVYQPFKHLRVIFFSYLFTLLLFIYLRAKGYYALGLYPILFCFGAVYLEKLLSKKYYGILKPLTIIIIVGVFAASTKFILPVLSPEQIISKRDTFMKAGLLRWEDGKDHLLPQDFADMLGWKELARKTDSCYAAVKDKLHTAVLCNNYGEAGAVNYYSHFKDINAVSENADYIDWYKLDAPILNVISIKDADDDDSLRVNERPYFDSIRYVGRIDNPYSREKHTNIYFFSKPKVDINAILRKEISSKKQTGG